MPTRPVSELFLDRAESSPEFRAELIAGAFNLIAEGDVRTAKKILRKYILTTMSFEDLAKALDKKPSSIKRMLSEKGNPTITNMAALIASLSEHEGIKLRVEAVR